MLRPVLAIFTLALLGACSESRDSRLPPDPVVLDPDATGHYCGMLAASHMGPKEPIILDGDPGPEAVDELGLALDLWPLALRLFSEISEYRTGELAGFVIC